MNLAAVSMSRLTAPAPMNLAAVSMSRLTALVWKARSAICCWEPIMLCGARTEVLSAVLTFGPPDITEAESGLHSTRDPARISDGVATNLAQVYIAVVGGSVLSLKR